MIADAEVVGVPNTGVVVDVALFWLPNWKGLGACPEADELVFPNALGLGLEIVVAPEILV